LRLIAKLLGRKSLNTSEGREMAGDADVGSPRWSIAPYFVVDDVVSTADYYRDKLGFEYERFWNEPPSFCMVYRSGVVIMLAQLEQTGVMRPNRFVDPEGGAWDAYIWIDDADALNAEYKSKGVKIVRDIRDQPYGCRDFDVEDFNGYRLCFGQSIERE
jgi:predicted enzyme related to lactoylglutathione lyase